MPAHRLQPGIAFEPNRRPAPCFRLFLLDVVDGATSRAVHDGLAALHGMLEQLPSGAVRELQGQPADKQADAAEQFRDFEHLFGFGRRLFDERHHRPAIVHAARPDYLAYLPDDGPFPALRWEVGRTGRNLGEADIAIQFTAHHEAAVNCAAVEVWKVVCDRGLPFAAVASFAGFGRPDGRGWLEFHDGVSNIEASQRLSALEAPADPPWMAGGTYMAFLRIVVDLERWRRLSRAEQELVVGRDKLTGAALTGTRTVSGEVVPVAAAPPGPDADDRAVADYIDPPQTTDPLLELSHVHRANQHRASPGAPGSLRMFRQGYEFLDAIGPDGPRLGLNFVSFQRDLAVVQHLLHLPGWLGDVDFGGPVGAVDGPLLRVASGGFYAVPPRGIPFPGEPLLQNHDAHN